MARKLKQPKEAIQDVKEKAFQRAIFHKRHIIVGKQAIEWYAMESPIDKNRESEGKARGQSNVDLIGRIEKTETFIVCEVKFSCNKKDSPQDAANEACRYYNVITKDALLLDSSSTHHQGEKDFLWSDIKHGHSELWVVANAAY